MDQRLNAALHPNVKSFVAHILDPPASSEFSNLMIPTPLSIDPESVFSTGESDSCGVGDGFTLTIPFSIKRFLQVTVCMNEKRLDFLDLVIESDSAFADFLACQEDDLIGSKWNPAVTESLGHVVQELIYKYSEFQGIKIKFQDREFYEVLEKFIKNRDKLIKHGILGRMDISEAEEVSVKRGRGRPTALSSSTATQVKILCKMNFDFECRRLPDLCFEDRNNNSDFDLALFVIVTVYKDCEGQTMACKLTPSIDLRKVLSSGVDEKSCGLEPFEIDPEKPDGGNFTEYLVDTKRHVLQRLTTIADLLTKRKGLVEQFFASFGTNVVKVDHSGYYFCHLLFQIGHRTNKGDHVGEEEEEEERSPKVSEGEKIVAGAIKLQLDMTNYPEVFPSIIWSLKGSQSFANTTIEGKPFSQEQPDDANQRAFIVIEKVKRLIPIIAQTLNEFPLT